MLRTETKDTASSSPLLSTDAEKIKRLIGLIKGAAASVKTAAGKDIFLVIGPTGAGKSTLINCFMDKELIAPQNEETGEYEFSAKDSKDDTVVPEIGHGQSCTTYPQVFQTKEGLAFCDTPGLFDTRSMEHKQSAYYGLHVAVSAARSLKGILFVCDFNIIHAARGEFFVKAVRLLTTILRINEEEYGRSVFFLITKTRDASHKQVMAIIKKIKGELEKEGKESEAMLLKSIENKPDSVITVSVENLIGEAGLNFASKMHGRLKGAQIKPENFSLDEREIGKDEYLEAYQHLTIQALYQIQNLAWKMDGLTAAEGAIKSIEQNISSNQALITAIEEKRQDAKKTLDDKELEKAGTLKVLNDRLRVIPDEIRRLEEIELKEINETETRRYAEYIEEIKRQHETNIQIGDQGAEENIRIRQQQVAAWEEKNRQARLQIETKTQNINVLDEEITRLTAEHTNINRVLNEELERLQTDTDTSINSLQRDGNYQRFPVIGEIKQQIDRHRNTIAALDGEIRSIETEIERNQLLIRQLRNDDSDYLVYSHTWNERDSYGTKEGRRRPQFGDGEGGERARLRYALEGNQWPIRRSHRYNYRYTYPGNSNIKRDEVIATISGPAEGSVGSVTGRFCEGRECGGTYQTPSHVDGSLTHVVYISRKNSPESIERVAQLQTLCDGLIARQTERQNRRDQPQHAIERLSSELTSRRNDEERRIREQAEVRRVGIENRQAEARRLFEASRNERNQRIQALRTEITTLQGNIENREASIIANQTSNIEIKQNGRIDVSRITQQKNERIREEEKRKDETIERRQQAAHQRRQRERDDRVTTIQQEITIQTESVRQLQEAGERLIRGLEDELKGKRQAALNYESGLRQAKERHVNLLKDKDLHLTYHKFMEMRPNYDAIIDLFTLLKLRENYSEFISTYQGFLETLFVKVSRLIHPMVIPLDSKNSDEPTQIPFESKSTDTDKPIKTPFELKASDTEQQKATAVFIGQLIGNEPLLKALFYEGARGVKDLNERDTFFDRKGPENRTCFMNTLQRQVILLHQLQKQNIDYKFVEDSKYLNHILDCGEKGRILLPELRIEFKGDQLSTPTKEQFRFLLDTQLSKGKEDRPLFITINLPGHFTLLSIEKRDNRVYYRYIDSLNNFMPGENDFDRVRKNKLAEIIQSAVGSEPVEIQTAYLKQQTNRTGGHYHECAMHTVFATLYQLKQGISADMSLMRKHLQLPGKNVTGNRGFDSEDALSAISSYRSLCELLHQQVEAAEKAKKEKFSVAGSPSTLYGRRSLSLEPDAEQSCYTYRATS